MTRLGDKLVGECSHADGALFSCDTKQLVHLSRD